MKPSKLFTTEFITLMILVLSLVIGAIAILVYKDRLPLWLTLAIGLWYPALFFTAKLYEWLTSKKGSDL